MGKVSSTITLNGTNGNDLFQIPSGYDITQVSVDGRAGTDTLDLSNYRSPTGTVGVNLSESGTTSQPDSAVGDFPFFGVPNSVSSYGNLVHGTIKSIEHIIGTSGNDFLMLNVSGVNAQIDGGPGNDYLAASNDASATLIGGSGSDWLFSSVPNATLIGGELVNGVLQEDPAGTSIDTFEIGPKNVTILDFQPGDRLLFDASAVNPAFTQAVWSDSPNGAELMVGGVPRVTIANLTATEAAGTLTWGFSYVTTNSVLQGGPGNDVLNVFSGQPQTIDVGPNSGNDLILNFGATDTLDFTGSQQVSWSDTLVNGQESLLGTFAGGSVTITGHSVADLSSMHIEGLSSPFATGSAEMSWWSDPSDSAGVATLF